MSDLEIISTAESEVKAWVKNYSNIIISDQEGYQLAADNLKAVKNKAKELEDLRMSMTQPLDDSKKKIIDLFKPADKLLEAVKDHIHGAMLTFRQAEDKRLAEERKKLAEQALKEEQAIKAAHAQRAQEALDAGDIETANYEITRSENTVVRPIEIGSARAVGGGTKKIGKYKVVDFKLIPDEYKTLNETLVGSIARNEKSRKQVKIPGIEFYEDETLSGR